MHIRVHKLLTELFALKRSTSAQPTAEDREKLMAFKDKVDAFRDAPGAELSEADETDRQSILAEVIEMATRQEEFCKNNGNAWA